MRVRHWRATRQWLLQVSTHWSISTGCAYITPRWQKSLAQLCTFSNMPTQVNTIPAHAGTSPHMPTHSGTRPWNHLLKIASRCAKGTYAVGQAPLSAQFNSPTVRATIRRLSCRERTPCRSGSCVPFDFEMYATLGEERHGVRSLQNSGSELLPGYEPCRNGGGLVRRKFRQDARLRAFPPQAVLGPCFQHG